MRTVNAKLEAAIARIDVPPHADDGPAPRRLARERAFETVKDAIITGRLAPGTRLVERELCTALGVSRSIVREVIRRLEAERLVDAAAHRGPRVTTLTARAARQIYRLREELEVLLVRDFIANADDGDVADLRHLVGHVQRGAAASDIEGLVVTMRRLYAVLTRGADNPVVADILETLHARISRLRVLSMKERGRAQQSVGEIAAIVAAIEARDAAGAERATRAYVAAAREAALRQLVPPPT